MRVSIQYTGLVTPDVIKHKEEAVMKALSDFVCPPALPLCNSLLPPPPTSVASIP